MVPLAQDKFTIVRPLNAVLDVWVRIVLVEVLALLDHHRSNAIVGDCLTGDLFVVFFNKLDLRFLRWW